MFVLNTNTPARRCLSNHGYDGGCGSPVETSRDSVLTAGESKALAFHDMHRDLFKKLTLREPESQAVPSLTDSTTAVNSG